jgi:hypothetical protein
MTALQLQPKLLTEFFPMNLLKSQNGCKKNLNEPQLLDNFLGAIVVPKPNPDELQMH